MRKEQDRIEIESMGTEAELRAELEPESDGTISHEPLCASRVPFGECTCMVAELEDMASAGRILDGMATQMDRIKADAFQAEQIRTLEAKCDCGSHLYGIVRVHHCNEAKRIPSMSGTMLDELRIRDTPSCDLCGGLHGSDHDCQNHDHANEDASCSPDCEACKDTQPNPFDVMMQHGAAIRKHGHTTQSTEVETIDITPESLKTQEGIKRVTEAQHEWDSATHELANYLKNVVDDIFYTDGDKIARAEYYSELQTLIGIREVKQEAFLRAVAGK